MTTKPGDSTAAATIGVSIFDRRYQRAPLRVPLTVCAESGEQPGHTRDISLCGVFVDAEQPLPVDTLVTLRFDPLRGAISGSARARVVRLQYDPYSTEPRLTGIGLEFLSLPESMHQAVDHHVRQIIRLNRYLHHILQGDAIDEDHVRRLLEDHGLDPGEDIQRLKKRVEVEMRYFRLRNPETQI